MLLLCSCQRGAERSHCTRPLGVLILHEPSDDTEAESIRLLDEYWNVILAIGVGNVLTLQVGAFHDHVNGTRQKLKHARYILVVIGPSNDDIH